MATTKIWAIKGDVRSLVKYVENPEKTTDTGMKDLSAVFSYATRDDKTEQKLFVSGLNCLPEIAIQQMIEVKKRFGKTDKILAFHAIQSFKPGEVTPQECHEIGMALAREMWGDRFQVVVATHLDKQHLHTHFAINSVSFADGKKYNSCKAANQRLREVSDRLCRERGLSVIENPSKTKTPRSIYLAEQRGEPTRYNIYRQAIDRAVASVMTDSQFKLILKSMGFEIKMTGKFWSIKMLGDSLSTRLYRLGEQYANGNITKRIYEGGLLKRPVPFHRPQKPMPQKVQFHGSFQQAKKLTGFRALYFHYLYLLGKLPRRPTPQPPVHVIFYEDLRKMDIYSAQIKLLARNKIDTSPQLQTYKDSTQSRMDELIGQRTKILNKLRRAKGPEMIADLKSQKTRLTAQITVCRNEIKLCDGIFENTARMKEKIALYREQQQTQQKQKSMNRERNSRDAR
jgi:hypothetical protein